METDVKKVTTVDIGKSRRLYITRAMIGESGQTPGCFGCMAVQKFHDEICRKRVERIYLHTAVVPTLAASVPEKYDVPEVPAGADAEGEAAARPSGSGEERERKDNDDPDEVKRTATTAKDRNGRLGAQTQRPSA